MEYKHKPLVWRHGEIKTPPFSEEARIQAGFLLRRLQRGDKLTMPMSRPMPEVGKHCHELRINDKSLTWRIMYRIDSDAVVLLEVFEKKTGKTPKHIIDVCRKRMKVYDDETR